MIPVGPDIAFPSGTFGEVGSVDPAFPPGFTTPAGMTSVGPDIASPSGTFGEVGSVDPTFQPGFTTPAGMISVGPDIASPPGTLGDAATQTAAVAVSAGQVTPNAAVAVSTGQVTPAAAVATPAGQGVVLLGGIGSSRYVKVDVTVVFEGGYSDAQSFIAPATNDAMRADVLPSPRVETNLGVATPAAVFAPLPANSANGEGVANSTTSAVAPFQVAIASPYATPIVVAAGTAPAAELGGSLNPAGGDANPANVRASDSAEGGFVTLDDMPVPRRCKSTGDRGRAWRDAAANLNPQAAARSLLIGATRRREAWPAINATERDGASRNGRPVRPPPRGSRRRACRRSRGWTKAEASNWPRPPPPHCLAATIPPRRLCDLNLSASTVRWACSMTWKWPPASSSRPGSHTSPPRASRRAIAAAAAQAGAADADRIAEAASFPVVAMKHGLANLAVGGPALLGFTANGHLRSSQAGAVCFAWRTPHSSRREIA